MVSPQVLKHYGCTPERLKAIFTAPSAGATPNTVDAPGMGEEKGDKPSTPGDIRGRFEARIRSRLLDGVQNNLKAARPYQAVDLCWDSPPIQNETLPLMLFAQGKINVQGLCDGLVSSCGAETTAKFFVKDPVDGKIGLNIPMLTEINIDLMRSYITRRLAAMDGLWSNLWPLWKYDPRGADDAARLRADVLTQRVDIIADSYNYRHFGSQCRRDMLLYGRSVAFARTSWDRTTSWKMKPTNTGEPGEETESVVEREGVQFINPHPSRVFSDLSCPLANLNTDTGPRWAGYWDIVRYGSLKDDEGQYYNLDKVFISSAWFALTSQFAQFFAQYFDPCVLAWPDPALFAPGLGNDRLARIGLYTAEWKDKGVFITQYYEKINPKREGIGEYDADVWLRLVVAGDYTVIFAEFMPSIPGAVGAINWNDSRLANQSMAMALLGYQDQASNIMTHMLLQIKQSLAMLVLIDTDSITEPIRDEIRKRAAGGEWFITPQILEYSATKLRELGIQNPKDAFVYIQTQMTNVIQNGLQALGQLLNLADRLLVLSPNELGQPNQREVSAREVQEISTSVQSVYSFINQGPREQTAAMKKLVFEALLSCGTEKIRVPVEGRYTAKVIKAAGFDVTGIDFKDDLQIVPTRTPILGSLRNLDYEYYFDSRDGSERVLNTQGATVIMQMMQSLLKVPGIPQAMGLPMIIDWSNLIIRMSGAPLNSQIELPVGQEAVIEAPAQQAPAPPPPSQDNAAIQQLAAQQARTDAILKSLIQQISGGGGPVPTASPNPQTFTPPVQPPQTAPVAA